MKTLSVVHLFEFDRGSRYNLMVAQGLLAHPFVDVSFGSPVHSLGTTIVGEAPDLKKNLLSADYIFRPDDSHYKCDAVDRLCDEHDLWPRVIYYDKKDSHSLDRHRLETCHAYIKRSWPIGRERRPRARPPHPILPMDYGMLNEYFHSPVPRIKDIDVVCLFPLDPRIGERRYALISALDRARHRFATCAIGMPTAGGRIGRRAIFDPPENNPWLHYMALIKRAKIVFTAYPERQDGDSRSWEAFSSGALVIKDETHIPSPHPFEHGRHCLIFNAASADSIDEAIDLAANYLARDAERQKIAKAGYDFALRHHMPKARIDEILKWASCR